MLNKKVSIVIPTWLTEGQDGKYGKDETFWFAKECLRLLIERTPRKDYELIVIDNGSTIGAEYFADPHIDKLIRNKENLGFAPACNQGFEVATGQYICCLNNDIIVWPGWLDAVLEPFSLPLSPPVGVVMPALVKNLRDAREAIKTETIDISSNHDVFGPQAEFGSLWIIEKSFFDELKARDGYYFDERFLKGFSEDRDLWRRVRLAGRETYRTHNTRVFHQGNMSVSKLENKRQYTTPNRIYLKKITEKEKDGLRLTADEKDKLRAEAQQEYEQQGS